MDHQDKTGCHPKGGYVEVTTVTRRRTLHTREAVAVDTHEEVERAREAAIRKAEAAHREDESAILEEEAEARGRDVVMEPDDPDAHFVGWCNATTGADHWVGLDAVTPAAAAMLLCGLKPDEESIGSAERAASDCTDGDDFKKLRRLFEVEDQGDPRRRTLADWLGIAKDKGAKHHPWVSRYLGITTPATAAGSTAMADLDAGSKPPAPRQTDKAQTVQAAIEPYIREILSRHPDWTARDVYAECFREAVRDGPTFFKTEKGLFSKEAGKTCSHKTIEAVVTKIRKGQRPPTRHK